MALLGRVDRPFPDSSDARMKGLKVWPEGAEVKMQHLKEEVLNFNTHSQRVEELKSELLSFEAKQLITHYKFGILLMRKGQKDENEFFNNGLAPFVV